MSQLMTLWYLSHRRPAKAQVSLHIRIRAVSPEPSLFAHMKYGSRRRLRVNIRCLAPTGWLRMRVWRITLRSMKSAIISRDGSNIPLQTPALSHAVHSLIRKGTGVARIKRTSGHVRMQILCKQNRSSYCTGRGLRAAGHVLFPLPGFDFGTSWICSFIVLTYNHSWWLSMSSEMFLLQ